MVETRAVAPSSEPAAPHTRPMTDRADQAHEQTTHHSRGRMTENAEPNANPDQPDGAGMPNTASSSEPLEPNGDAMNETQTNPTAANPTNGERMTETTNPTEHANPRTGESMPPDPLLDDEPIPDTVRMISYEDAARASLRASILALGIDEVRVLQSLADRLQAGQRQYGLLRLESDRRDFRGKEAREEIEDSLVYFACAWLLAETRKSRGAIQPDPQGAR